jgi:hypothetical protein
VQLLEVMMRSPSTPTSSLSSSLSSPPQAKALDVYDISGRGELYYVEYGLRHRVHDLRDLERELKANFTRIPPKIAPVSEDAISQIPLGYPQKYRTWPDGSLVRPSKTTAIFLMNNSRRHLIPDWPTMEALGLAGRNIEGVLDLDMMTKIPLGFPLQSVRTGNGVKR